MSSSFISTLWFLVRAVCRATASLRLAVVLIGIYAAVIGGTTLLESRYGTAAVRFGIYQTGWFFALNVLLAVNVLTAVLVRFPWRRRQIGFLLTHGGILVLLLGAWMTWQFGIAAKMSVYEGHGESRALQDARHFALEIRPNAADAAAAPGQRINVPFRGGPFNWDDYGRTIAWFPWGLTSRSRGVLYDREGIRLEVLNYCSDSQRLPVPRIGLRVAPAGTERSRQRLPDAAVQELELAVRPAAGPHAAERPFGLGQQEILKHGPGVQFWLSSGRDETEAFLHSAPRDPLPTDGEVILFTDGKSYSLLIEKLRAKPRQPLGDTGLEVEFVGLHPRVPGTRRPGVVLNLHGRQGPPQQMILYAALPALSRQDYRHRVFGMYWFNVDPEKPADELKGMSEEAIRDALAPRLDILQGHDRRLYYRVWEPPHVTAAAWPAKKVGDVVVPRERLTLFRQTTPLVFLLESYLPSGRPRWVVQPRPFRLQRSRMPVPRALVRLTVDERTEEFWLAAPIGGLPRGDEQHVLESARRRVRITFPDDSVELGFQVRLKEFKRVLDPGSGRPAHYSSLVDFVDRDDPEKHYARSVFITLNAPADFVDPKSGRTWRFFQHHFRGPWRPGDEIFEQKARGDRSRSELYLSLLDVNYDPGRALKYASGALIILGIAVVYLQRLGASRKRRTNETVS